MRIVPPLSLAIWTSLVFACADDAPQEIDSGILCQCPVPTAADISFDDTGTTLTADDVQAGISELAARPLAPVDAHSRITIEEQTVTSPMTGTGAVTNAVCPVGSRALGGSCEAKDTGTSVASTRLQQRAYECIWTKPEGVAVEFVARVTCLSMAE